MTPLRRRLRRLRRGLWLTLSATLISAAVLVGLVNLALPWLASDTARLEAWIESRIGQPVRIEAAGGQWLRSGPAFRLTGLRLGGVDGIDVDAAELRINVYSWLLPSRALVELRLNGLELEVSRREGEDWELRGLVLPDRSARGRAPVDTRLPGALSVRDSRLRVLDEGSGLDLALERVNLTFSRERGREFWNGSAWPVEGEAPLGFVIERDDSGGRGYLVGSEVQLTEWLGGAAPLGIGVREGRADIQAWAEWQGRHLREIRVEAELSDVSLLGTELLRLGEVMVEPRTALQQVAFGARWRARPDGWRLDIEDLRIATMAQENVARGLSLTRRADSNYRLEIERLPLGPLAALAALSDVASPRVRGWLYASAASGRLEDAVAQFDGGRLSWFEGHLESLATRAHRRLPGLGPLSMRMIGDSAGLVATLDDQHPLLDAPRLFPRPLLLQGLDGRLGLRMVDGDVQVELADASLSVGGFDIDLDAALQAGEAGGPLLSGAAAVGAGRIEHVHDLWPEGIVPPRTLRWLQTALVSGALHSGSAVFHGPLDQWPFDDQQGRLVAVAQVGDALLAFNPDWPPVDSLDATVKFVNVSLEVESSSAQIVGNRIGHGRATISDLKNALLDVHVEGGGSGSQLLGLLRRSPIYQRYGSYLIGVDVGGRGDVSLDLHFALKKGLGQNRVDGEVRLHQADLRDIKWGLAFDAATGPVRFDADGFAADELSVWLGPDPAHLSIAVGSRTGNPDNLAEASLRGVLPLSTVTSGLREMEPLWPRVKGRSHWTLDLAVERGLHGLDGPKRLILHSDMVGAEFDLPEPLRKPAERALPVFMEMTLPAVDGQLALKLGDVASLSAQLPGLTHAFAASVVLGGGEAGPVPAEGLSVRGRLSELDLSGWMRLGAAATPGGSVDVALDVDHLGVLGRTLDDVELVVRTNPTGTEIAFAGPAVQGLVEIPAGGDQRRGVTANFERLHWPERSNGAGDDGPAIQIDPAALPPLHLWVGDLKFGDAELGETRLETYPSGDGLHMELFESHSPNVNIRARGDWRRDQFGDRSSFELSFTSQNLGRMLDALGYSGFVEGGQTIAQFNVAWPGSPADFALARLTGGLELSIGSGRILDVEPGAGRILGLASLQAIPRRLSLDFSDLFSPGMSFNAITGSFRFSGGSAWTEDLRLDGPAAAVGIRGRTGLSDRSYDQELDVFPRIGGALPVFGAIAGGPAGAAAGLVVQNVLSGPLDQMARARYRVTGTWEHPEIEQIPVPRPRARQSGSG